MKRALAFFDSAIKKDRLAHLYLITGPKGSGKVNLSFLVSLKLLKRVDDDEEKLLDQIKGLRHPNVVFIEPAGSVIQKSQIEALQREFSKTSLVDGPRIYIINQIDKVSTAASNSLLKFLEEPEASNTYGFLLTRNIDTVLPTIQSRSQIIHLSGTNKAEIKETLIENEVSPILSEILPEITTNIDEAMELLENEFVLEIANFLKEFADQFLIPEIDYALDFSDKLSKTVWDREWFRSFTNVMLTFFVDLVRYKVHRDIVFESLREDIKDISAKLTLEQLEQITDTIRELITRQRTYLNLELSFQKILVDCDKLRKEIL